MNRHVATLVILSAAKDLALLAEKSQILRECPHDDNLVQSFQDLRIEVIMH